MLRGVSVKSTMGFFAALALACSAVVFAQQAPQGQAQGQGRGGRGGAAANAAGGAAGGGARGGGARAAAADPVLVVKVEWVRPEGQTGQVPIVQGNVADPNLELKKYGKAAARLHDFESGQSLRDVVGRVRGALCNHLPAQEQLPGSQGREPNPL